MAVNLRQIVSPPAFTPSPYGLLSVVQFPAPGDAHWMQGITYQASCVITMGNATYDECLAVTGVGGQPPPPPAAKAETVELVTRGATPFTPYVEFDCSAVGNEDARAIAENALAQSASWQVERAFWTGSVQTPTGRAIAHPHLANATQLLDPNGGALLESVPVTGISMDIADGLGFLEQQLADCYNGVGVIHVAARVLPTLVAWGLVTRQGNALTTFAGNRVAVGAGYTGSAPNGSAPSTGESWIYATGAVFGYQSSVFVTDAVSSLDRAENTRRMIAEKTYVLGWDCCHAGVSVLLGVPNN